MLRLDSRAQRIVAALLSGVLFSFAENLHPWWPAAWLAPIPVLCAAFMASRSEAVWLAVIAALVGRIGTTPYYLAVPGLAIAIIAPIGRAIEMAVVVSAARQAVVRWRRWPAVFVYPALMAGLDMIEGSFSGHGAAASLAYSQMNAIPIIQIAALAGTSGIVFVLNLFASAIAVAWYAGPERRQFRPAFALATVVVTAAVAFGLIRLVTAREESDEPVGLAVVDTRPGIQARSPNVFPWTTYKEAIEDEARRGAHVIVLPERIAEVTPAEAEPMRQALAQIAESNKIYLLVGITIDGPDHKENRAWLFNPAGKLRGDYAKRHLVPGFEDAFTPGTSLMVRIVDGTPTGIAICRDMDFPRLGREYSERNTRLLIVPAWDFRMDDWLHSRIAILRGVEDGYTIARAARDGVLTISDSYGRVLYQEPSSKQPYSSVVADVPLGTGTTLYARIGNAFGWFALTLGIFLTALSLRVSVEKIASGADSPLPQA